MYGNAVENSVPQLFIKLDGRGFDFSSIYNPHTQPKAHNSEPSFFAFRQKLVRDGVEPHVLRPFEPILWR
jgi:hypothetical protein